MRLCLIASSRHPIAEPFAGGMESLSQTLAHALTTRGHQVTMFAAAGSVPPPGVEMLTAEAFEPSAAAQRDPNALTRTWIQDHHAYLALMLTLQRAESRFEVVHNHSLHYLPIAMASTLPIPVLTTLHTPPLAWLESAIRAARGNNTFTSVSRSMAAAWCPTTPSHVVPNGVDTGLFSAGPGGGPALWSGRMVPEKAPHEAIDAARMAGLPLDLIGPESDPDYVREQVYPRLGVGIRYLGHLRHREVAAALGRASVAVITPAWDEPYGLVAAEAMACGTPVAAYRRGAVPEVVGEFGGVLAEGGDVAGLAIAIRRARGMDRELVRQQAETSCSLERMVGGYEELYRRLRRGEPA